ncbi:MAG: hypothetical protein PHE27_05545 [Alphaproteobacteria bacterium]|nr:hypothetical protein [Alphaproteobacteria bacterium]
MFKKTKKETTARKAAYDPYVSKALRSIERNEKSAALAARSKAVAQFRTASPKLVRRTVPEIAGLAAFAFHMTVTAAAGGLSGVILAVAFNACIGASMLPLAFVGACCSGTTLVNCGHLSFKARRIARNWMKKRLEAPKH